MYIVGFPKCGTTTLASYLLKNRSVVGVEGVSWHPALSKESYFFNGILGRYSGAFSPTLYRSFFPTVLTRWWRQAVLRAPSFLCLDACPLTACIGCNAAKRIAAINPDAKLIFMVRDPVDAVFSAEITLRNFGLSLDWSFMEDVIAADPRFADTPDDVKFWESMDELGSEDPLPVDLPARLFGRCSSVLRAATFADRIQPFLEVFPRQNIMFVELDQLTAKPEETVASVLSFIGVESTKKCKFSPLPDPSTERRGRRMHPAVRRKLQHYFAAPNQKLFAMMGKELPWGEWSSSAAASVAITATAAAGMAAAAAADEEEGRAGFPIIPVVTVNGRGKGGKAAAKPHITHTIGELLPGASPKGGGGGGGVGKKDSGLVRRVVSVSARV